MKPLIVLVGVSGSGKTTLANKASKMFGLTVLKSYTTRLPRENDSADLSSHTFCALSDAIKMYDEIICSNWFNNNFYFATKNQIDSANLYVTDVKGLKDLYKNYCNKPIISIFLDVDSSIAASRMEKRGDSNEAIMSRLQHDADAFKDAKDYVDFVCDNSTQDKLNENVEFIDMLFRNYRG
jgi:guanylate kinase